MRKLKKQAHDAVNKVHAAEDTVRIHTELDRLGGKTHLICPTAERPKDPECEEYYARLREAKSGALPGTDPAAAASNPPCNPASCPEPSSCATALDPGVQPDMIHPTIVQDMRAFDLEGVDPMAGVQFNMDFPPTVFDPRQPFDLSAFPELDFVAGLGLGGGASPANASLDGAASGSSGAGPSPESMWALNDGAGMHVDGLGALDGVNGMHGINGKVPSPIAGMDAGVSSPPVLDATWQTLVEQLGF